MNKCEISCGIIELFVKYQERPNGLKYKISAWRKANLNVRYDRIKIDMFGHELD